MNRRQLMRVLAEQGYKGPEDWGKVSEFLLDNPIDLSLDGKKIDIKSAFDKIPAVKKVILNVQTTNGEEVETRNMNGEGDGSNGGADDTSDDDGGDTEGKSYSIRDARDADAARRAGNGKRFGDGTREILESQRAPGMFNADRAAYKSKIRAGKAVFDDPDLAAYVGAGQRLAFGRAFKHEYAQKARDIEIFGRKAYSGYDNAAGGVFVLPEFASSVLYLAEQYGKARQLAGVIPMSSNLYRGPRLTAEVAFTHTQENAAITAADVATDQIEITARSPKALVKGSNEMWSDAAYNVGDTLAIAAARGVAKKQDQDFFNGDGSATYGNQNGLKVALPTSAYIAAAGNAWSAITAANILTLMGSVENVDDDQCVFVCSRQFYYQVMMKLDTAASQFRNLVGPAAAGGNATYLTKPVHFSQVLPTASASASICLYYGHLSAGASLGERKMLEIAQSDQRYFDSDQWALRMIARYGVNCQGDGRGSTYGPIVALKTT